MDDEIKEIEQSEQHSDYKPSNRFDAAAVHHLSGMYQNWFLDYASYVILERAVPHLGDGLKPVQRRILHSMKRMDDGRYNKVANIVGHTMQFHPHGDASIGDALVQLGQKDLLIDTQGNWGNILTGSSAAAPRYIEARLSKFALDTVFNPCQIPIAVGTGCRGYRRRIEFKNPATQLLRNLRCSHQLSAPAAIRTLPRLPHQR